MIDIPDFSSITSFIISPPPSGILLAFKILFIGILLFFLASIIYLLARTRFLEWLIWEDLREILGKKYYGVKRLEKVWAEIVKRLRSGLESDYKLAVIESDGILDDVLKRIGYKGENLGERLGQLTPNHLPNLDEIRKVHKIRNDIVRDPDYRLTIDEAKKVLAVYKKTLEDLGAF